MAIGHAGFFVDCREGNGLSKLPKTDALNIIAPSINNAPFQLYWLQSAYVKGGQTRIPIAMPVAPIPLANDLFFLKYSCTATDPDR